jgi:hypothetical protein
MKNEYTLDLERLREALKDATPHEDGVLTFDQAMALLGEVMVLRAHLREANEVINRLKGMLS